MNFSLTDESTVVPWESSTVATSLAPKWPEIILVEKILEITALLSVSVISLIGNIFLWAAVLINKPLRTCSNALVLSLSCSDLVISWLVIPAMIVNVYYGDLGYDMRTCHVFAFLAIMAAIASTMSISFISINRYVHICHPSRASDIYTPFNTGLMIAFVWIASCLYACPPFFGWGAAEYVWGQSSCLFDWRASYSYTLFCMLNCYLAPSAITTFCYTKIIKTVWRSRKNLKKVSNKDKTTKKTKLLRFRIANKVSVSEVSTTGVNVTAMTIVQSEQESNSDKQNDESSKSNKDEKSRSEKQISNVEYGAAMSNELTVTHKRSSTEHDASSTVTKEYENQSKKNKTIQRSKDNEILQMTFSILVIISFLVLTETPYICTTFLAMFAPGTVPRVPDIMALMLAYTNFCCNPIIYGLMNKRFNEAYKRLLRCGR